SPMSVLSSKGPVASAPLPTPEPVVTAQSSVDELYDLWTLPQGSASPRGLVPANPAKRGLTSNQHLRPSGGRKIGGNKRVTRRKAVALLATGGVVAAITAFTLDLTSNRAKQQGQHNAANLAKNAAMTFTNPADGKASVLVHLADGTFVAYDRAC